MYEIVLNKSYGGFRLSEEAVAWLSDRLPGVEVGEHGWIGMSRHHPALVEVVRTLGPDASDNFVSFLEIVEIEEDRYFIENYDGFETVVTPKDMVPRWNHIK